MYRSAVERMVISFWEKRTQWFIGIVIIWLIAACQQQTRIQPNNQNTNKETGRYQESWQAKIPQPLLPYKRIGPDRTIGEIGIFAAGDSMLDWGVKEVVKKYGSKYPGYYLRPLVSPFQAGFCNLETPVVKQCSLIQNKLFTFYADPDHLEVFSYMGIRGFVLANNHMGDCGLSGMKETSKHLAKKGFDFAGLGSYLPLKNRRHIDWHLEGKKGENERVVVLSYGHKTIPQDRATEKNQFGVYFPEKKIMSAEIDSWRQRSDYLIISIHWGTEYYDQPLLWQIELAHWFIDQGADVVVGHHSHWVQAVERYKQGVILYSLGNFLFGSNSPHLRNGYAAGLIFRNKRVQRVELYPLDTKNQQQSRFQPKPLTGEAALHMLHHVKQLSAKFHTKVEINDHIGVIQLGAEEFYAPNHMFRWQYKK